jgi:transcriptional regulator with XRE-family HTH domain
MARPAPSAEEQQFQKLMGRRIASCRTSKHMTQKHLSGAIGRDRTTITRLEKGSLTPTPFMLTQIAAVLDVHASHFLEDVNAPSIDDWVDRVEARR